MGKQAEDKVIEASDIDQVLQAILSWEYADGQVVNDDMVDVD